MSEPKKISFGFSKLTKKTNLFAKPVLDEKLKVELIDCLEGQSIKIKDAVEVVEGPLIIPVQGSDKNLLDRVREANELKDRSRRRYEKNGDTEEDVRPDSELTLDELAARQLLREAKNYDGNKTAVKVYSLPAIEDKLLLEGSVEPTVDDYENVPISEYGLAMLRGMGWKDGQGIGKSTRVTPVVAPELRPKGMGLGANKMVNGEKQEKPATDKDGKELSLNTGVHAKVIAGKDKGNYCTVQGLDDEAGRVIVKMALKGDVLSLNEFLLVPVTADEFGKCSKILNNAKYEEFKDKSSDKMGELPNGKMMFENPKEDIISSSSEERYKNKEAQRTARNYHRSRSPDVNSSANNYKSKDKLETRHTKSTYRDSSSSSDKYNSKSKQKNRSRDESRERARRDKKKKKQKKERRKSRSRSRSRKSHKIDDFSSDADEKHSKRKAKKKSKHRSRSSSSEGDHKKSSRSRRQRNASDSSSERDERRHRRK